MLLSLLFAVGSLVSCRESEILNPVTDPWGLGSLEYAIIEGDTVKLRKDQLSRQSLGGSDGMPYYERFVIVGDTVVGTSGFRVIKNIGDTGLKEVFGKDQNDFRMITFGGSLSGGVRDGGVNNESIQTNYTALIAAQMGINYVQPLFDKEDYNGFGVVKASSFNPTGSSQPKYKLVTNNTALGSHFKDQYQNIITLKPYSGKPLDNYSVPFGAFFSPLLRDYTSPAPSNPFHKRLELKSIYKEIEERDFDFFVVEGANFEGAAGLLTEEPLSDDRPANSMSNALFHSQDWEKLIKDSEIDHYNYKHGLYAEHEFLTSIKASETFYGKLLKKRKPGILINGADSRRMPYYQKSYADELVAMAEKHGIFKLRGMVDNGMLKRSYLFGNAEIDSLIAPNVNVNLKKGFSYNTPEIGSIGSGTLVYKTAYENIGKRFDIDNRAVAIYAKALGVPLFDINELYKKINEGRFVTDDGIQVIAKWPGGNFFSSDGMRPTAFGHAVIANEVIKLINTYYKTRIPLINTREYLKNNH